MSANYRSELWEPVEPGTYADVGDYVECVPEFTPTMQEVLACWVSENGGLDETPTFEEAEKAADRALAAHDRQIKAEAWDEGHSAGADDVYDAWVEDAPVTANPYRAEP